MLSDVNSAYQTVVEKIIAADVVSPIQSQPFTLTLKIGPDTYTSSGETCLMALQLLKRPIKLMGKGVLTVSQGTKKKELLMMPERLKRLFYPKPDFQAIQAKQLSLYLKWYGMDSLIQ